MKSVIRKALVIGLIGASSAMAEAIASAAPMVAVSHQIKDRRREEELKDPFVSSVYPSYRKSKGEKKRAASNRRRKGWA